MSEMTPKSAETDVTERLRVERVIRESLPSLLCGEYGETEAEWRELRSVHRIARALANQITSPAQPPTTPPPERKPLDAAGSTSEGRGSA